MEAKEQELLERQQRLEKKKKGMYTGPEVEEDEENIEGR